MTRYFSHRLVALFIFTVIFGKAAASFADMPQPARMPGGGTQVVLAMMNAKARELGMTSTHFNDPTGLSSDNMSTARDLAKMVKAASEYPLIREFSTTPEAIVDVPPTGRSLAFRNTNALVRGGS